jgi:hypothetical protein
MISFGKPGNSGFAGLGGWFLVFDGFDTPLFPVEDVEFLAVSKDSLDLLFSVLKIIVLPSGIQDCSR